MSPLIEIWTPGFIPGTLKTGQVLLGLSAGLLLGFERKPNKTMTTSWKSLTIAETICLISLLLGAILGLALKPLIGAPYLLGGVFLLAILTGGAVAANLSQRAAIIGVWCLSCLMLGASSIPSLGAFPDVLVVIAVNIVGLVILVRGAALVSHWAMVRQSLLWPKVGVRIAGSWVLAISVMMMAFQLSSASL